MPCIYVIGYFRYRYRQRGRHLVYMLCHYYICGLPFTLYQRPSGLHTRNAANLGIMPLRKLNMVHTSPIAELPVSLRSSSGVCDASLSTFHTDL